MRRISGGIWGEGRKRWASCKKLVGVAGCMSLYALSIEAHVYSTVFFLLKAGLPRIGRLWLPLWWHPKVSNFAPVILNGSYICIPSPAFCVKFIHVPYWPVLQPIYPIEFSWSHEGDWTHFHQHHSALISYKACQFCGPPRFFFCFSGVCQKHSSKTLICLVCFPQNPLLSTKPNVPTL